jgi:hypothetical protein
MKRHEFIRTVVRAEMSSKEQIRQACLSQDLARVQPEKLEKRKERFSMNTTMKWLAPVAACAIIALAVFVAPNFLRSAEPGSLEVTEPAYDNVRGDIDIYYIDAQGDILTQSVYTRFVAQDVFAEWARLNNLSDVSLVSAKVDSQGTVTASGDVIGYTPGNSATLVVSVKGFDPSSVQGELWIKTLEKTFSGFLTFGEFELNVFE